MRNKSLVLAFSLLAAWSQPALSEPDYESGNFWLKRCEASDDYEQSACIWFVNGFFNGVHGQAAAGGGSIPYCKPDSVTYGQSRDIWVKYMRDNPASRHKPGGLLLMISLLNAFPCPKGSQ